ncbi:uncharacterized protein LOC114259872 [Camellia sinensis]|uniref:uncharacterized protein LOC114259872 n=1 Tax=Camellia sinensis TaxID=4442 RepID=UPI0010364F30|nr:uncharacterized protein LOC114259872 [Camellia sinensis]
MVVTVKDIRGEISEENGIVEPEFEESGGFIEKLAVLTQLERERFEDSERIRKTKAHEGTETAMYTETENTASIRMEGTASTRTVIPEPDKYLSTADGMCESYESDIFEANGYKWRLYLYPNGDEKRNGKVLHCFQIYSFCELLHITHGIYICIYIAICYISLYLVIAETIKLPLGWEVNVNFKLFVYNQIQDKYLTIQEWGFPQLLSLSTFSDPSNGYLVLDKCMFGANVFVLNYSSKAEFLSFKELDIIHTWKIEKFSSLDDKFITSDVFTVESCEWISCLYPKGSSEEKDKHLWFSATSHFAYGDSTLLSLTDLHDSSKGFLVNDTLIIECKVIVVSKVKNFAQ